MMNDDSSRQILTVSQLNHATSQLLNEHFLKVLVEGEISNLSMPSSGHWYFTLKDANAQVRCAMFKNQQRRLMARPENGMQVVVKAEVSLYEPRGDYQLIVEALEDAGEGALRRAFEALKRKLANEGLFDAIHKQQLPVLPQTIGLITSPTGAAIRDMLTVLKRRFPAVSVIVYPVAVQGDMAKLEIAKAIVLANEQPLCDVLVVGRGGGSLEDLWAFNEEIVARAIFASEIPIISAVGHETDFTIADFVADLRAATPSAAAEHATPDQQDWLSRFVNLETRLQQHIQRKLNQQQQNLDWLSKRLEQQHPGQKMARNAERLSALDARLKQAMRLTLRNHRDLIVAKQVRLWQYSPALRIHSYQQHQIYLQQRLGVAMQHQLEKLTQRLVNSSETLHAVSPLATLNRGYALAIEPISGQIVRSVRPLKVNDLLTVRFGEGSVETLIKTIKAR